MSRLVTLLVTMAVGAAMAGESDTNLEHSKMLDRENEFRRKSRWDDNAAAELRAKRKAAKQAAWDKRNRGR